MTPSPPEFSRYHRQMLLPGFGEEGQRRLLGSHALIVGCGALGCVIADLLARAGVGTLTVVDRDVVEETNLQRQVLFDESDVGLPKAEAARRRLERVNSGVRIRAVVADFNHLNAERIGGFEASGGDGAGGAGRRPAPLEEGPAPLEDQDAQEAIGPPGVILDGTDNFQTRYLINDLAVKHGVPYVYAGAVGTGGMQMTVLPGRGPCLRCVFPEPPPPGAAATCDTAGILGPVISIVAGAQAVEGLKVLLGQEERVSRTLLEFDVWSNQRRRLDISGAGPRGDCPCCGWRDFAYLAGAGGGATALCGRHAVQVGGDGADGMDLDALARRLAPHGRFTANEYLLRGVLERERGDSGEPIELTVFPDGRTIVRGTDRVEVARSIHARYVGS